LFQPEWQGRQAITKIPNCKAFNILSEFVQEKAIYGMNSYNVGENLGLGCLGSFINNGLSKTYSGHNNAPYPDDPWESLKMERYKAETERMKVETERMKVETDKLNMEVKLSHKRLDHILVMDDAEKRLKIAEARQKELEVQEMEMKIRQNY
jgi:hypothetical protein